MASCMLVWLLQVSANFDPIARAKTIESHSARIAKTFFGKWKKESLNERGPTGYWLVTHGWGQGYLLRDESLFVGSDFRMQAVRAENPDYSFKIQKDKSDALFRIQRLDRPAAHESPGTSREFVAIQPGRLVAGTDVVDLLREPAFKVVTVENTMDGVTIIKFECGKHTGNKYSKVVSGRLKFGGNDFPGLLRTDDVIVREGKDSSKEQVSICNSELKLMRRTDGESVPERYVNEGADFPGRTSKSYTIIEYEKWELEVPTSENCLLSHYGLPEPVGKAGGDFHWSVICGGILAAIIAATWYLRRFYR